MPRASWPGLYLRSDSFCYDFMRKLLLFFLLAAAPALAQVSPIIDRTDMPASTAAAPVDSLRLSIGSPVLPTTAPPLSRRGANQTWNYASLVPVSQRIEQFVALPAVATYQFTFGALLGGVNRATVASPQNLPIPAGTALPISDPYQFFNTSGAGVTPSTFRSVGYGATVAGFGLPVTYRSQAEQDIIYRFPLSFASAADSSNSFFSISVPGTGFISQKRKRVNKPDAWGTLTTPFGTFQTVRVVTRLEDHDSISVGGISQGFDVPVTREYKWLAKTQHVPVLAITTMFIGGQETVTRVEYRDIYRRIIRLGTRDAATNAALMAYPNPSAVGSGLTLAVPASSGPFTVSATDVVGRQLFRRSFNGSGGQVQLGTEVFGNFRGVVLLTVQTAQGTATRRIVRE
jgi:hypothetical protein